MYMCYTFSLICILLHCIVQMHSLGWGQPYWYIVSEHHDQLKTHTMGVRYHLRFIRIYLEYRSGAACSSEFEERLIGFSAGSQYAVARLLKNSVISGLLCSSLSFFIKDCMTKS
jgi:hypothetical protein